MRRLAFLILLWSLFAAGSAACADDTVPPKVQMITANQVNVSDGAFMFHTTDLSIGPLSLERFAQTPASPVQNAPFFGYQVTSNFDIYVSPNLVKPSGQPYNLPSRYHPIVHIGATASGVYEQANPLATSTSVSPINIDAYAGNLAWTSGAWVYTDSEGDVYTFNPSVKAGGYAGVYSQRVSNIVFADGRQQTFSYDASGHLKLVSDTSGYAIVFDWNSSGYIADACAFNLSQTYVTSTTTCAGATLSVSYGYTSNSLTSFTDPLGKVTTYGTGLTCITPPGYSSCQISNVFNGGDGVQQQTWADGSVWQVSAPWPFYPSGMSASANDPEAQFSDCDLESDITDPFGKVTMFILTKQSPCSITDPLGRITYYKWKGASLMEAGAPQQSEGSLLTEVDFPEGGKYLAEYYGPCNEVTKETWVPKPGSPLSNRVIQYAYSGTTPQNQCKPIFKIDAAGHETDWTYASWGGTLTAMLPAPATGAARPLKVYTYVQKSAYIKNAGGTLVSTGLPVWLPASETDCQTVAGSNTPTCDTGSLQVVTTYEYGADGTADDLLLRGKVVTVSGTSRRTCYSYDSQGNKISQTQARAGLSACP